MLPAAPGVQVLTPGTCGYYLLLGQRDFASVFNLRFGRWGDYTGFSSRLDRITGILLRGKTIRKMVGDGMMRRGWNDVREGSQAKKRNLKKWDKETDLSWKPPECALSAHPLILVS